MTDTFVYYLGGGLSNEPFNNSTDVHDLNCGLVGYSDPHRIWKLQFWLLAINLHEILGNHQYQDSLKVVLSFLFFVSVKKF